MYLDLPDGEYEYIDGEWIKYSDYTI
jgi:hypothetical protein